MNTSFQLAVVALGGGAGAAARALCAGSVARWVGAAYAPMGTLTVNVLGSLAMGVLGYLLLRRLPESEAALRPLLMTGFLGGFTTFSAFSLDVFGLLEEGRAGFAMAYALGSVTLSIAALFLGWGLARMLAGAG